MNFNVKFNEMEKVIREHAEAKDALKSQKEVILSEFGWDSYEYNMWYEQMEALKESFPYTTGDMTAFWKMDRMLENDDDELIMDDFNFDEDRESFVNRLRKFGLKTFITTDNSTGLMKDIHGYIALGCKMLDLCEVEKKIGCWTEKVKGIRFAL